MNAPRGSNILTKVYRYWEICTYFHTCHHSTANVVKYERGYKRYNLQTNYNTLHTYEEIYKWTEILAYVGEKQEFDIHMNNI